VTTDSKQLFETSVEQVAAGQVRQALTTLLDALADDPAHAGAVAAAGRICRMLGAPDDAQMFEQLEQTPDDPEAMFLLGHRLVGQERPDAGAGQLMRALKALPPGPKATIVRRELAYARFLQRRFADCLTTLAPLADSPDLAESEVLDVLLLQVEATLYTGKRSLASDLLEQLDHMDSDDSQRQHLDALHALHGRASHWPGKLSELGLREWHYIQHGGVILKTAGGYFENGSLAGRFDILELRMDMIAFLLQRFADLMDGRELLPEVVIGTGSVAAPLAHALGQHWDLPVLDELAERAGRDALVVAANAREFTPLAAGLMHHRAELRLMALNLDWSRDADACPEVAGVLARRVFLPWEKRYSVDKTLSETSEVVTDSRPDDEIGTELVSLMAALPDDGGQARSEFEQIYAPLSEGLVLGNERAFPLRRQFTHVSPAWTPMRVPGRPQPD